MKTLPSSFYYFTYKTEEISDMDMNEIKWHENMKREVLSWIDDSREAEENIMGDRKISMEVLDNSGKDWMAMMSMVYNLQSHYKKLWNTILELPEFQGDGKIKRTINELASANITEWQKFNRKMRKNWQETESALEGNFKSA